MKLRVGFKPEAMDFNSKSAQEAISELNELIACNEGRIESLQVDGDELNVLISMTKDYIVSWKNSDKISLYRPMDVSKLANPEHVKQIRDIEGNIVWQDDGNFVYEEPAPWSRVAIVQYIKGLLKESVLTYDINWITHTHEGTIVSAMVDGQSDYNRIIYYRPHCYPNMITLHCLFEHCNKLYDSPWNDLMEEVILQLAEQGKSTSYGVTQVTQVTFNVLSSNGIETEFRLGDFPTTKSELIKELFDVVNNFDHNRLQEWEIKVKQYCFDNKLTLAQATNLLKMSKSIAY